MPYAPATDADVRQMLATIGVGGIDELFADIPAAARIQRELDLPLGVAEPELMRQARAHADETIDLSRAVSFLGVGSRDSAADAMPPAQAGIWSAAMAAPKRR